MEEKGLDHSRVFVCDNGVETDVFYPPSQGREARSPNSPVVIGAVAVFRPIKDLPTLMEAFARVHRAHPQARLVIAGSGPVLPELEARRFKLGLEESCSLLPPPGNVADLMRSIAIFVSSSLSEAFSNPILEAMACGCCPVGSRVGGTPELIEDGERGFLFEPGNTEELDNKLSVLIENPLLRHRFADKAAVFARGTLSIQAAAGRLADFYTALLVRAQRSGDRLVSGL